MAGFTFFFGDGKYMNNSFFEGLPRTISKELLNWTLQAKGVDLEAAFEPTLVIVIY